MGFIPPFAGGKRNRLSALIFPHAAFQACRGQGVRPCGAEKYLRQALSCLLYDPVTTIIYLKALAKDAYIHNCRRYHWKCELTELVNDYPELRNPNADSYNEEIQKKYLAETASLARGFVPIFFEHAEKLSLLILSPHIRTITPVRLTLSHIATSLSAIITAAVRR